MGIYVSISLQTLQSAPLTSQKPTLQIIEYRSAIDELSTPHKSVKTTDELG